MDFIKKYHWVNFPISRLKLFLYVALITLASIGAFVLSTPTDIESIKVLEISSYIVSLILTYFLLRRTYSISAEARYYVLSIFVLYLFIDISLAYFIYDRFIIIFGPLFVWFTFLMLFEDARKKPEVSYEKIDSKISIKDFIINLFTKKEGRLNRSIFFYSIVFIGFLYSLISDALDSINVEESWAYYCISQTILFLVFLWPNYCLYNKRINDFNGRKTTVYLLVVILPVLIYALIFKAMYILELKEIAGIELSLVADNIKVYLIAMAILILVTACMYIQVLFKEPIYDENNPLNDLSVNKYTNILRDIFIVIVGLYGVAIINNNYDDISYYINKTLEENKSKPVVMTYYKKSEITFNNKNIIQNCMQTVADKRLMKNKLIYFNMQSKDYKIAKLSNLIDRVCKIDNLIVPDKTHVKIQMINILLRLAEQGKKK